MITARFKKSLTVAVEQETYDKLKAITDESMVSLGHWVRVAIQEALEEENEFNEMSNLPSD